MTTPRRGMIRATRHPWPSPRTRQVSGRGLASPLVTNARSAAPPSIAAIRWVTNSPGRSGRAKVMMSPTARSAAAAGRRTTTAPTGIAGAMLPETTW